MAPKTSVDKDRVTIDGVVYLVAGAGAQQWSVSDEFGEKLGYFTVRGRAVTPEDYRLTGAPPVLLIAKLWVAENLTHDDKPAAPVSKGVCQISVSEGATEADLESARARRAWLKKQPGMKASYLVRDPATGKATTIAIWQTRAHLDAAEAAAGAEGAPLTATSVELFPFVEEP
ncbi:MAG TPA: hypothetical protein VGM56_21485 [Byssovorax sp.]|jgi:hypothetical protein